MSWRKSFPSPCWFSLLCFCLSLHCALRMYPTHIPKQCFQGLLIGPRWLVTSSPSPSFMSIHSHEHAHLCLHEITEPSSEISLVMKITEMRVPVTFSMFLSSAQDNKCILSKSLQRGKKKKKKTLNPKKQGEFSSPAPLWDTDIWEVTRQNDFSVPLISGWNLQGFMQRYLYCVC